jgi:hypothetical protein
VLSGTRRLQRHFMSSFDPWLHLSTLNFRDCAVEVAMGTLNR